MTRPLLQLLLTLTVFTVLIAPASAEVYKWTDEEGNVHFGDEPVESNAESVRIRESKPDEEYLKRLEAQKRYSGARAEERARAKEKEKAEQDQRAKYTQACGELKQRLVVLEAGGRIYRSNEKGERVYYSDEEIAKEIESTKAMMNDYCK